MTNLTADRIIEDYKARLNFDDIQNEDIKKIIKDFPLVDPVRIQENLYNNNIPFDETKYRPYQYATIATPQMTNDQVGRASDITHILDSDYLITTDQDDQIIVKHELIGDSILIDPLIDKWSQQTGDLLNLYRDEKFGVHNEWKTQPDIISYQPQNTPWDYDPNKNYQQIQEDRKSRSPDESFENVEITDGKTRGQILDWLGENTDNTRSTYTKNSNSALEELYNKFKAQEQEEENSTLYDSKTRSEIIRWLLANRELAKRKDLVTLTNDTLVSQYKTYKRSIDNPKDPQNEIIVDNKTRSEIVEFIENNIKDVLGHEPEDYTTYQNSQIIQIYRNIKNQNENDKDKKDCAPNCDNSHDSDQKEKTDKEIYNGKTRSEIINILTRHTESKKRDYQQYKNTQLVNIYKVYLSNSDQGDNDQDDRTIDRGKDNDQEDKDQDDKTDQTKEPKILTSNIGIVAIIIVVILYLYTQQN